MSSDIVKAANKKGSLFENKEIKDLVLEKWDISFSMNCEIFKNIMEFLTKIHTDVIIKFYKNEIFIYMIGMDEVQYVELSINAGDVLDYDAGFYTESISDALEVNDNPTDDSPADDDSNKFTLVIIDMKDTIDEIGLSTEKDQLINIRIDTSYHKKVEFHCPDGMIYWSRLIAHSADNNILSKLDNVYNITRKIRNDPSILKNILTMEPSSFSKLCKIGSKSSGKNKDSDKFVTMNISDNGIFAASGDTTKGRILILDDVVSTSDINNDNNFDVTNVGDVSIIDDVVNDHSEENDVSSYQKGPDINQKSLLATEIADKGSIIFNSEYFEPFDKLKGLSPITIEIRIGKPVVIKQTPYSGINVFFAIAPRIDKDDT